ncbi:MAG TPA: DUF5668 domain-containing protein [Candidatus Sulfotelmatobacter sp.]|nr:DUF5668 domain-containing protein [Candidatus Sulfotelmatobacter sp.]
MNCANHSDQAAVAFCRTCGKPLCNQCTRDVRGVIYCESCLAARLDGTAPAAGFTPAPPQPQTGYQQGGYQQFTAPNTRPNLPVATGPNPTVAGILGAIPLGLGAVYCGQYAKGLVYLGIFVTCIVGFSADLPWQGYAALGIFLGFFWVYQILDSIRTAKAIQSGEPAPDPLGLVQMFGGSTPGEKPAATETSTNIPAAAAVLIGLGVLFLINTVFDFSLHRYWPLILIVLGVWLFAKSWGLLGTHRAMCLCERCRTRRLMGPAVLVTIGVLFLLDNISRFEFHRTWPAILLVIGVVKLVQSNASYAGHVGPLPPGSYPPPPPPVAPDSPQNAASNTQPTSSGEVKNV